VASFECGQCIASEQASIVDNRDAVGEKALPRAKWCEAKSREVSPRRRTSDFKKRRKLGKRRWHQDCGVGSSRSRMRGLWSKARARLRALKPCPEERGAHLAVEEHPQDGIARREARCVVAAAVLERWFEAAEEAKILSRLVKRA